MTKQTKQTTKANESKAFKQNEIFTNSVTEYLAVNEKMESASMMLQSAANWYRENNIDIGVNAGKKYPLRLDLVNKLEASGLKRTVARNYVSSLYTFFKNPKLKIFDLNASRMMAINGLDKKPKAAPKKASAKKPAGKTSKGINNLNEALAYIAQQNKTVLNSIAKFENEIVKLNPDIIANIKYLADME